MFSRKNKIHKHKMKKVLLVFQLLLVVILANAQMMNPVKFSSSLKTNGSAEAEIVFTCKIQSGWHVYSTGLGADGPISASFHANKMDGAQPVGKLQARGREISKFDPLFEMNLRYFEGSATFVQKIKFTKPNYNIDAYLEYGACNEQNCLPPSEATFKKSGKSPAVDGQAETDKATDADQDPAALAQAKADSLANLANSAATDSLSKDTAQVVTATSADTQQWCQRYRQPFAFLYLHHRFRGRIARPCHALYLAYHSDDGKFLLEACQGR